tara:strand:+ start:3710 stop:3913 length:204 start_codon:yes stop_codon:yes gene_type:complete
MDKQSTISKLEAHEKECAIRYQYIEKQLETIDRRLDNGSERFKKMEAMIWGLYVMGAAFGASKYMGF